jgi:chromosome segregation ATPase
MAINVKKYTKDQMAKMVEDAQAEVQELRRVNAALTEQISQLNGEAITRENVIANLKADADALRNKLTDTDAALGRTNAELTYSVAEKNALRNDVIKMTDRAAFECGRANYAEAHPWKNLWAWVKRKLVRHE